MPSKKDTPEDYKKNLQRLKTEWKTCLDLVNFLPGALLAIGRDGTVLDANDGVADLLGYDRGEIIGLHVSRLLPKTTSMTPDLFELGDIHELAFRGALFHIFSSLREKNGSMVPVILFGRCFAARPDDGKSHWPFVKRNPRHPVILFALDRSIEYAYIKHKIESFLPFLQAVSTGDYSVSLPIHEKAESHGGFDRLAGSLQLVVEDLREAREKNEALFASMGEGLIVIDEFGDIERMNSVAEYLLGCEAGEAVERQFEDIFFLVDAKGQAIAASDRPEVRAMKKKETVEISTGTDWYALRKGKQSRFPVGMIATPLARDGRVRGAVIIFRDISVAKEIDRMKTEFVSLASHQLRTPLTSMNWYLEILMGGDDGTLNKAQMAHLKEVYQSSKGMLKLIEDLLNISRVESGRLKVEPKRTNLVRFIQGVIEEVRPLGKEKRCAIFFKKPAGKPPSVLIDPTLLRQVIHNFLTNAIRYSKKTDCRISVSLFERGGNYIVSVKDNGIGIPKNEQQRIFERFYRAANAIESMSEGSSGLGLYIAKLLIDMIGGKIWFESKGVGKGSTFYVSIPKKGMKKKEGEKGLAG